MKLVLHWHLPCPPLIVRLVLQMRFMSTARQVEEVVQFWNGWKVGGLGVGC